MNERHSPELEREIAALYDAVPAPAFVQRLEARLNQSAADAPARPRWLDSLTGWLRGHPRLAPALAGVIVLTGVIMAATPQGRAFSQDLLNFFTTVSQGSLPPAPTPVPAPTYALRVGLVPQPTEPLDQPGCGGAISPIASTFICQLRDAQAKLGFVVKSFPAGYVQAPFSAMSVDQEHRAVRMTFRDRQTSYSLAQGLGGFPRNPIYEGAVQPARVGQYQAEIAAGEFVFTDGQVDRGMAWEPGDPAYDLRWKEGEHWYSVSLSASQSAGLSPADIQAKLILIAENLVSLDQGIDQLTAGHQPSIKDSAGFAVKEPGLLPEGFRQVPDGSWSNLTAAPRVGMRYEYTVSGQVENSLILYQMPIPGDDKTLRREFALLYQNQAEVNGQWVNTGRDEAVKINGITGAYLDGADSSASALYWRDDAREYLLIYQWTPGFGGRLDTETLLAIAESLR